MPIISVYEQTWKGVNERLGRVVVRRRACSFSPLEDWTEPEPIEIPEVIDPNRLRWYARGGMEPIPIRLPMDARFEPRNPPSTGVVRWPRSPLVSRQHPGGIEWLDAANVLYVARRELRAANGDTFTVEVPDCHEVEEQGPALPSGLPEVPATNLASVSSRAAGVVIPGGARWVGGDDAPTLEIGEPGSRVSIAAVCVRDLAKLGRYGLRLAEGDNTPEPIAVMPEPSEYLSPYTAERIAPKVGRSRRAKDTPGQTLMF